ncbi:MAG: SOS response-associated peptidase [Spirochaetaceae bacterium]
MCYNAGIERLKPLDALLSNPPSVPARAEVNAMARPLAPVRTMNGDWHAMHWLLIPPWITRSDEMKPVKIWLANARIEELEHKKLYKPLTGAGRCIVRFSWFFEWRHEAGRKHKYRIFLPDDTPLLLPGLWHSTTVDGERYDSFTVCTMEARGIMRYVHNSTLRQPVVVTETAAAAWLDTDNSLESARAAVLEQQQSASFLTDPQTPPDI